MKRVTHNPLAAVESMLDACRNEEVNFFFSESVNGKSICVYPTNDDVFAAQHAVQIAGGDLPLVQAGLIGLIHLHNRRYLEQTRSAVDAFIAACKADFYFGFDEGF